jgi:hypothetical protein
VPTVGPEKDASFNKSMEGPVDPESSVKNFQAPDRL